MMDRPGRVQGILNSQDPYRYQLPLRWLSLQLEDYGLRRVPGTTDGMTSAEKMLSMIWEAATTGKVVFPDGNGPGKPREMQLRPKDWIDTWRFIFDRIEGLPDQRVDLHVIRGAATDLAEKYGMDAEELVAEAERLALPRQR